MFFPGKRKVFLLLALLVLWAGSPLFSEVYQSPLYVRSGGNSFSTASFLEQNKLTEESFRLQTETAQSKMLQTAFSSENYLIVPGDTFSLAYFSGNRMTEGTYQVDSTFQVSIPEVGNFDCENISFAELRRQIVRAVLQSMPYAAPKIAFVSCGFFEVPVVGEVRSMMPVSCWGASTLRDTMGNAGPYASSRNVMITHEDGTSENYDLYKAVSTPAKEGNPNLRPGDTVTYFKADRIVTLDGAVYDPGTYQLLPGENLGDLIKVYGKGLLPSADQTAVSVTRVKDGKAEVFLAADPENTELLNFDRVSVVGTSKTSPYATVEGAIAPSQSASDAARIASSASKLIYSFFPGEKVSSMLKSVSGAFVPQSDLENMYMIRGSEKIMLQAGKLLSGQEAEDPVLQPEDKVIVPFVHTFVTVNGAVNSPGRVAYVPSKDASYYIGLSGGYSEKAKAPGKYKVVDAEGKTLDSKGPVPDGSVITVDSSYFDRDLGRVASVLAIISALIVATNYFLQWAK